jgi:hypothetical protein
VIAVIERLWRSPLSQRSPATDAPAVTAYI